MSIHAVQPRVEQARPLGAGDRDVMRLLGLLETNQGGALTIAALRERGIETPAMSVYELQLAGYEIERVHCERPDGYTTLGYRLRAAPGSDQPMVMEVDSDEIAR